MTGEECCPGSADECTYSEEHELALTAAVMRTIEQYNLDRNAAPCPLCLRDAMLAVAALLHLEAARLEGAAAPSGTPETLADEFGDAAAGKMGAIAEVVSASPVGWTQ